MWKVLITWCIICLMIKDKVEKIKIYSEKYRFYIMPVVLLLGFFLDFLTLQRVDRLFDNLILITHLFILGTTIALLFAKDTNFGQRFGILRHAQKIEYVMLFSFGAVFSGSIIFYSKSASIGSSWPFLLVLLILMLGTEFQKKYFQRLVFQINFYFIAIFSYLIILIPVLKRQMGPEIFLISGVISLFLISFYFLVLYAIDGRRLQQYLKKLIFGILSLFALFNFLYFTNIIPPIPLSLKFSGVYHSVFRVSNTNYVAVYEPGIWWNVLNKRSRVVNRKNGEPVYVFSSVFAPTRLDTKIYHQWQYFDPIKYKWIDSTKIELDIVGGREGGFRGYSLKRNLENGKWRVLIETERGQRLGQIKFKIQTKTGEIVLKEEVL